jgi:thiol-disulfide isomerase/thioredoxin
MTKFLAPLFMAAAVLAFTPSISMADVQSDLKAVIEKVKEKIGKGEKTEAALAEELKGFDSIIEAQKGAKTDDVAEVAFWKALLYVQVIPDQQAKGIELLKKIQTDYPETKFGKQAPVMVGQIEAQAKAAENEKKQIGAPLKDFNEKDLDGKDLSIASRKGKVVLVDFWATWCGPCVRELPNVLKTYEKYHDKGFEIIGISLDSDKDKLTSFIKEKKMTWPQYFDGKGWENKISTQYGITSIPATYLLDKEGKVLAIGLRGDDLEAAVGKALGETK